MQENVKLVENLEDAERKDSFMSQVLKALRSSGTEDAKDMSGEINLVRSCFNHCICFRGT